VPSGTYTPQSAGFSPPPGPLPRRYGPRPAVAAARQAILLLLVASGLLGPARDLLSALEIDPLVATGAAILLLAAGWSLVSAARRWERSRSDRPREITAQAVRFTYRGLRVHQGPLRRAEFGWGEVAGLVSPGGGQSWSLEVRRDDERLLVRLPEDKDWSRELVAALRDRPVVSPERRAPTGSS
jgi:hypothetical protein